MLNLLLSRNLRIQYISSIKGHISRMEQVIKFNIGLGLLFMTLVYKFKWFEWNDKWNLSYWTETWKIKGYFFNTKTNDCPPPPHSFIFWERYLAIWKSKLIFWVKIKISIFPTIFGKQNCSAKLVSYIIPVIKMKLLNSSIGGKMRIYWL